MCYHLNVQCQRQRVKNVRMMNTGESATGPVVLCSIYQWWKEEF